MTETPTEDLASWLTAVWDEEERLATEAAETIESRVGSWQKFADDLWHRTAGIDTEALADLVELHSPASVLARIAAGRKILASQLAPYPEGHAPNSLVMKLQAEPYKDRPGFRSEWLVERQGVEQ